MALGQSYLGTFFLGDVGLGLLASVPVNLNSYQNIDSTIVNYWTLDPFAASIYSFKWQLQTDLVDTFDSPNLLTYQSDTVAVDNYVMGYIYRGIVVPTYPRLEDQPLRMYWRVRAISGVQYSSWGTSYFDIPSAVDVATRTSLLSFLPDALYDKSSSSDIYKIHDNYAQEFEKTNRQLTLVNNDLYIKSARDSALQVNFGDLLGMIKPDALKMIDYREILRAFMVNVRTMPALLAIRNMVYAIYRTEPTFKRIVNVYGEYIYDVNIPDAYVFDTNLNEEYVWDNNHLANGIIIEVNKQIPDVAITKEYVEGIIRNMGQVLTPIYIKEI